MSLDIFVFLLLGAIAVLIIINSLLLWLFGRSSKRLDELLEKGKIKDFKDVFLSQKNRNDQLEEQIKNTFLKIENLEDISRRTIQKVSVIRFNPFNEMGGNQSFVIALLDAENNGFVISSLFVKEASRVYAKTIKKGKSDYSLSKEEQEAIAKAIK